MQRDRLAPGQLADVAVLSNGRCFTSHPPSGYRS
jgi:hypothetical protein